MKGVPVSDVRNFVIMGHTGSGKTTLADALVFKLGLSDRLGSVDAGTSQSDFTDEEKNRKISIFATSFEGGYTSLAGKQFNMAFTDTPGYMDFFGQVIAAARAAETGLIVVDASSGIQVGTRRAWKCCQRRGVAARSVVITGLDKDNTDFSAVLASVQESFGSNCVPVVLPTTDRTGVIDVLAAKEVPEDLEELHAEAKGALVEVAAETDDTLIEKYLEGQELSAEEIAHGLDSAVSSGALIPVFVCMAKQDIGVTELLEGIARLFPSPTAHEVQDLEGHTLDTSEEAPFAGLVWRTVVDPFVGQLSFVRVFSGTLTADCEVMNSSNGQKEKVGALLVTCGKKQSPVERGTAGDIVAIPKLKATKVGDSLCAMGEKIVIDPIHFPNPVMFQAVEAKTQADEDRLSGALTRLTDQDPTLHVERNAETHETVLKGLGDVHIDTAVALLKIQSNVQVTLSQPKVAYRETVTGMGEGHYKHKKQSGGRGQYGEVYLRVTPRSPEESDWFSNEIVGGSIPGNFIPAVQKGLLEGMLSGSVAGYPVENVRVHLYDGSYHDVDSSEVAFKIAGARALRDAMSKAKPVLLEPIMTVKVTVPDQFMGDINGDLNHKRGRILGMGLEEGAQVITADVPQSELFRYAAELRSVTGGQGSFEMEFSRYDIVPANVAQKIIAAAVREKEED